jgi:hypothetical protein
MSFVEMSMSEKAASPSHVTAYFGTSGVGQCAEEWQVSYLSVAVFSLELDLKTELSNLGITLATEPEMPR